MLLLNVKSKGKHFCAWKQLSSDTMADVSVPIALGKVGVFQCRQCMTVVGDTVALLLTREGGGSEQSIVLTQCRGAVIDSSKLLTCDKGNDAGSTYYPAKCAKCKTQLGKVYKCTPSHLDDHRDCFTLDVSGIYTACALRTACIVELNALHLAAKHAEALCIYHLDDGPADTVPPNQFGGAIASLHDMISKLQRVVCHLNDRLSTVEQISGIAPPAIVPAATVPHKKDEADAEEEKGGADEGESEGGRKRLKRKR